MIFCVHLHYLIEKLQLVHSSFKDPHMSIVNLKHFLWPIHQWLNLFNLNKFKHQWVFFCLLSMLQTIWFYKKQTCFMLPTSINRLTDSSPQRSTQDMHDYFLTVGLLEFRFRNSCLCFIYYFVFSKRNRRFRTIFKANITMLKEI